MVNGLLCVGYPLRELFVNAVMSMRQFYQHYRCETCCTIKRMFIWILSGFFPSFFFHRKTWGIRNSLTLSRDFQRRLEEELMSNGECFQLAEAR